MNISDVSNSPAKMDVMETTDAHLVRSKNCRYGLDLCTGKQQEIKGITTNSYLVHR